MTWWAPSPRARRWPFAMIIAAAARDGGAERLFASAPPPQQRGVLADVVRRAA